MNFLLLRVMIGVIVFTMWCSSSPSTHWFWFVLIVCPWIFRKNSKEFNSTRRCKMASCVFTNSNWKTNLKSQKHDIQKCLWLEQGIIVVCSWHEWISISRTRKKKKEKLCLERFCHYCNKKETKTTKRKIANTYIPVSHLQCITLYQKKR